MLLAILSACCFALSRLCFGRKHGFRPTESVVLGLSILFYFWRMLGLTRGRRLVLKVSQLICKY